MTHPADLVDEVADALKRERDDYPYKHTDKSLATVALDAQQAWLARQPVAGDANDERWDKVLDVFDGTTWGPRAAMHAAMSEAVAIGLLAARPVVPEWAEHVSISIGAHRQEWMERGQPHHNWARSCWGKGPTLDAAIADMVSKPCVTQEDWDATLQLNPHIAAAVGGEGTR